MSRVIIRGETAAIEFWLERIGDDVLLKMEDRNGSEWTVASIRENGLHLWDDIEENREMVDINGRIKTQHHRYGA